MCELCTLALPFLLFLTPVVRALALVSLLRMRCRLAVAWEGVGSVAAPAPRAWGMAVPQGPTMCFLLAPAALRGAGRIQKSVLTRAGFEPAPFRTATFIP